MIINMTIIIYHHHRRHPHAGYVMNHNCCHRLQRDQTDARVQTDARDQTDANLKKCQASLDW